MQQAGVTQCFLSDGATLILTSMTEDQDFGLNNSIFNDKHLLFWWDLGKKKILTLTINYCKDKRRTERTYNLKT